MTLFFFLNVLQQLIEHWAKIAKEKKISDYDFIATVTELTASSIVNAYKRFSPGPIGQVLIDFIYQQISEKFEGSNKNLIHVVIVNERLLLVEVVVEIRISWNESKSDSRKPLDIQ
jgi:hypothetical protein